MASVFDDSYTYLNSSIRTYVNAKSTLDKLFAIKLIVLSMIVAADALIEKLGRLSDTSFQSHMEESSLFLPMAAYEQRITDIYSLEERGLIPSQFEFSRRLRTALDTLKIIHGQYSLRSLLAINIKEFINESQFFIIDIQTLLEKK
ncbi:MAG: hypothetical protein JSW11_21730 [Candidatus Heimdallarchaeota archaeon]|nr:MAG: hypothetical protein JSW11_21730 [Candidatus Heimdallarchaeota archaeon]